uniref:Uncharacterized protein n=1 Tax=Haptolina brevifila TaxID=156173 RepID=A0A7S2BTH6_9EUKA|mmetsp:Transcript_16372/g.32940  ORF Transcript_16372/g.32940 Transcript_16372/m.32940 type:complete len:102 (+) Transcript_16372:214-519(+)
MTGISSTTSSDSTITNMSGGSGGRGGGGSSGNACPVPIVFAVTNFDPDEKVGQPNFDDIPAHTQPCGTKGDASCPYPNRVGNFDNLAVSTTLVTTTVLRVA